MKESSVIEINNPIPKISDVFEAESPAIKLRRSYNHEFHISAKTDFSDGFPLVHYPVTQFHESGGLNNISIYAYHSWASIPISNPQLQEPLSSVWVSSNLEALGAFSRYISTLKEYVLPPSIREIESDNVNSISQFIVAHPEVEIYIERARSIIAKKIADAHFRLDIVTEPESEVGFEEVILTVSTHTPIEKTLELLEDIYDAVFKGSKDDSVFNINFENL